LFDQSLLIINNNNKMMLLSNSPSSSVLLMNKLTSSSKTNTRTKKRRNLTLASSSSREIEVCTKKECRRLGSMKTLEFLRERSERFNVSVKEVKCLSECGLGPNVRLPCGALLNKVKGEEQCFRAIAKLVNDGDSCDV
jgi:hypothetical protein